MRPRTRFILLFLLLPLAGHTAAQETTYIPARDYLATAEREINAAKSSVRLYLYLLNYDDDIPDSQPARLLKALVRAHQRGVQVDVLLNRATGAARASGFANDDAAAFLRAQGIPAAVTAGPETLHAKLLVVDDRTVLAGSTNWSAAAFARNGEGNFLIRSTTAARAAVGELGAFPREPLPSPEAAGVPVPASFLAQDGPLRDLVQRRDERSFDLIIYLLRLRARSKTPAFRVDKGELMAYFGYRGTNGMYGDLKRLRDHAHLITYEAARGEDPIIQIRLEEADGEKPILLPETYFTWRWDRLLPMAAKAFYLISLNETPLSKLPPPTWSRSHETLSARYGVSVQFLANGVPVLRRAGLLDVRYAPIKTGGARRPNVYATRPFYDPVQREQAFQALELKYTPAQVKRARQIAALVYSDSDVSATERLIQLEQLHGAEPLDEAVAIITAKDATNPRRSMGYLIRTIETIAEEGESSPKE